MFDCHTHILPGIDDGSDTPEESRKMLEQLKKQGVGTVWLTSHFYPFRQSLEEYLHARADAYALLAPIAEEIGITVLLASETYLSKFLFHYENLRPLCVNGGRFLLTELPFGSAFTDQMEQQLNQLISVHCLTPILAHIERYPFLLKNENLLKELVSMGCLAQTNLGSLDDGFLTRRKLLRYLETGLVHVVGTDCHNLGSRAPDYAHGAQVIQKKLDPSVWEAIVADSEAISFPNVR